MPRTVTTYVESIGNLSPSRESSSHLSPGTPHPQSALKFPTVQVSESTFLPSSPLPTPTGLRNDTVFALLSFPAVQLSPATQRGRLGEAEELYLCSNPSLVTYRRWAVWGMGLLGNSPRCQTPEEEEQVEHQSVLSGRGPSAPQRGILQSQVRHGPGHRHRSRRDPWPRLSWKPRWRTN